MKNPIRVPLSLLMGSSLAAFGIGYIIAPTEPLDTEVTDSGILSTTTTQVLSATVHPCGKKTSCRSSPTRAGPKSAPAQTGRCSSMVRKS